MAHTYLTRCWATMRAPDDAGAFYYGQDPWQCRETVTDNPDAVGLCPDHIEQFRAWSRG